MLYVFAVHFTVREPFNQMEHFSCKSGHPVCIAKLTKTD